MAGLAEKQIRKNGTKCVLRIPTNSGGYDPDAVDYTGGCAEYAGYCLVSAYKAASIDGTIIRSGDKSLLCVLPAEPLPSISAVDVYDKSGAIQDSYEVVSVESVCPDAATVILYRVHGRK
jgi:hypothetical protein